MKTGELAHLVTLNASAIRYCEKCGLLAPPPRLGGQRRDPAEALDRVLLIRSASDMGFTQAEIKLFLSGLRDNAPVGPRWKKLGTRKLTEVEQNIAGSLKLKTLLGGPTPLPLSLSSVLRGISLRCFCDVPCSLLPLRFTIPRLSPSMTEDR